MKKVTGYNLRVGFKLMLFAVITSTILLIPLLMVLGISISAALEGQELGSSGALILLILPLQWIINGYFVNKYRSWIFK